MVIKEVWYVQFRAATDTTGVSETLGTYSTPEEAKKLSAKCKKLPLILSFIWQKLLWIKLWLTHFFLLTG